MQLEWAFASEADPDTVGDPRRLEPNEEERLGVPRRRTSSQRSDVPTGTRYLLVGRDGAAPAPGIEVTLDGGRRFVVSKLASSPLPADAHRCAFLEPQLN